MIAKKEITLPIPTRSKIHDPEPEEPVRQSGKVLATMRALEMQRKTVPPRIKPIRKLSSSATTNSEADEFHATTAMTTAKAFYTNVEIRLFQDTHERQFHPDEEQTLIEDDAHSAEEMNSGGVRLSETMPEKIPYGFSGVLRLTDADGDEDEELWNGGRWRLRLETRST